MGAFQFYSCPLQDLFHALRFTVKAIGNKLLDIEMVV